MAGKKQEPPAAPDVQQPSTTEQSEGRKRWVKLTPRDHVLKQIEIQRELVEGLRAQALSRCTRFTKCRDSNFVQR